MSCPTLSDLVVTAVQSFFQKLKRMFYIHRTKCITPQQLFLNPEIQELKESVDNKMKVIEPAYEGIPMPILRRMGKAVRMGVGAALPIIGNTMELNGIVIGTANGGMEDCIKFLNQVIEYEEGTLTPTNFVQSTTNAIASQLALLSSNKGYNITHVHRGLSFENAIIDVDMLIKEHPENAYLLGGVDEISTYQYNIDYLAGWFKEKVSNKNLYEEESAGSIAGEGSAMFVANGLKEKALAKLQAITLFHSEDELAIAERLENFLKTNLAEGEKIDLFLSGENGDNRYLKYYSACEKVLGDKPTLARFKHMTGEYATATAAALWLACHLIKNPGLPTHMLKRPGHQKEFKKILIYNNFKGVQNAFILISAIY
jgi:hypothetical protein